LRTAFLSGNLIFGPVAAAFAPPARDLHIDPAADALYIVLSSLLQFEEAGQAELTLHVVTPSVPISSQSLARTPIQLPAWWMK
jgi:hypothetical protein